MAKYRRHASDDHSHLAQVRGADLGIEGGDLSIGEMTTMPVVDLRPTERTPGPPRVGAPGVLGLTTGSL